MIAEIDKKTKKQVMLFLFACYFLYLISISVKMVYGAELVEMIKDFSASKSSVALGLTFYYVIYGVSQIIVAMNIKKIKMRFFIAITVGGSALTFALVIFVGELWQMWVILALNGFLQSGIWGGCMYFFGKYIPQTMSAFAAKFMSTGMAFGTALTYGVSAFFVGFLNWKYSFLFFAVMLAFALILFLAMEKSIETKFAAKGISFDKKEEVSENDSVEEKSKNKKEHGKTIKLVLYATVISFLLCCVYYSISNWFPSLLAEKHGLSSSYSILITILLPICMMPGPILANNLCEKKGNIFTISLWFTLGALACVVVLCFVFDLNIFMAIFLSVTIQFLGRGATNIFCAYFPFLIRDSVDEGFSALILNAFASLGAAVIPFLTGWIMDIGEGGENWTAYYITTAAFACAAVLMLIPYAVKEIRKAKNTKKHD